MHFSFWEKAGFAVLVTAWVVWGTHKVGDILVHADELHENAYKIEVADSGDAKAAESAAPEVQESAIELLASASTDAGAKVFKKCAGCHSDDKGGANKVGPNLWNVVGADKGHHPDFAYSDALKGLGGKWTYEDLDHFLTSPKAFAKGTKMTFAGLKKASDRAAVILFLRSQNDNPPPLP